ncbi:MAG TPA: PQQ-dependent sugar dehydrogenase [Solirubrobacterales bacterium]|nr:PQQ-dependent sugar dehydrogenase [Solirubrobacterales bacterium]
MTSRIRALRWTLAAALALALLGASGAQALSLQEVGSGFEDPIYVTSSPDDPGQLLVVERRGPIESLEDGTVTPFADISSVVSCCEGEGGLQSIALPPDFATTGRFYVDYTGKEVPGEIHVAEMQSPTGPLRNLLTIPHPTEKNHIGGQLQFGPDGDLYISTGDGGGKNDEQSNNEQSHNAQNKTKLLGKILRIHPDPTGPEPFFTVPAGNPFPAATFPANTIWSYGLRNPYRFSFDRAKDDMVIGDVGQDTREEVDFAPSPFPGLVGGGGTNYGWNCREGYITGPATDPECATPPASAFTNPVFDYPHAPDPDIPGPERCAIIGGYVVRDPSLGALDGNYVYSDLCSGVVRSLRLPETASGKASGDCSLGLTLNSPVSFGEGGDGHLYAIEQGGTIYRLTGAPPASCPVPLPPPVPPPSNGNAQLKSTQIGITAQRRRVERGKRALLTVFVSPCEGRKGDPVELLRNGRPNGTRYLSRACTARFLPRIRGGTTFSAVTRSGREYEAGKSRKLTIRLAHRHKHR